MTIRNMYEEIGSDMDVVIARFGGNEQLLNRFVRKFPADPNFELLRTSIKKQDNDEIVREAHTIKGLAANLGFTQLSDVSAQIVSVVRQEKYESIEPLFLLLEEHYRKIVECIEEL